LSVAIIGPWLLVGASSPAQAQGACECPAGFSPIQVQNSSSPLFNNRPDHFVCQSQSQSQVQQVCLPPGQSSAITSSGITGQKNANRRRTLMFEGQWTLWDELEYQGAKPQGADNQGIFEDPFADVTRTRDRGTSFTSATGTIGGQTVSGHTTDVGGGGGAYYTKSFNPSANQTISVGGLFRYDSLRTTFDVDPLAGAFGNSAIETCIRRRDFSAIASATLISLAA
jgi:hypothetical protein